MAGPVEIRVVPSAATRDLRALVLRPGRPAEDSIYPGDDDPATVHLAAFRDRGVVGIASLYAEDRAGGPPGGRRLRGMATHPSARAQGVGQALLEAALEIANSTGAAEVWCNARSSAAGFYRQAGFEETGGPFEIEGIGPHIVMRRGLLGPGGR